MREINSSCWFLLFTVFSSVFLPMLTFFARVCFFCCLCLFLVWGLEMCGHIKNGRLFVFSVWSFVWYRCHYASWRRPLNLTQNVVQCRLAHFHFPSWKSDKLGILFKPRRFHEHSNLLKFNKNKKISQSVTAVQWSSRQVNHIVNDQHVHVTFYTKNCYWDQVLP